MPDAPDNRPPLWKRIATLDMGMVVAHIRGHIAAHRGFSATMGVLAVIALCIWQGDALSRPELHPLVFTLLAVLVVVAVLLLTGWAATRFTKRWPGMVSLKGGVLFGLLLGLFTGTLVESTRETAMALLPGFLLAAVLLIWHLLRLLIPGRRASTHRGRDRIDFIVALYGCTMIAASQIMAGGRRSETVLWCGVAILVIGRVLFASIRALSIPSTLLSFVPLALVTVSAFLKLQFLTVGFLFLDALPGLWFPTHRRLVWFWKPTKLPRLPKRQAFTLIELLIVVAIVAISIVPAARLSSRVCAYMERISLERRAANLAQDQITLLRANGGAPEIGQTALAPELLKRYPMIARKSTVTVQEGPNPKLRWVVVESRIQTRGIPVAPVSYAVLLPVRKNEGAPR